MEGRDGSIWRRRRKENAGRVRGGEERKERQVL
jgi:hypothetical protein